MYDMLNSAAVMIKINHMVEIVVHVTEKAVYVYKLGVKPTALYKFFF